MRIGTDISLKTCKDEGYLMMEYKVKELTPKSGFNADANVRFISYIPDYLLKEMGHTDNLDGSPLLLDVTLNTIDVWELYQDSKSDIDEFCDEDHKFTTTPSDLLNLASAVNSYCGLDR